MDLANEQNVNAKDVNTIHSHIHPYCGLTWDVSGLVINDVNILTYVSV